MNICIMSTKKKRECDTERGYPKKQDESSGHETTDLFISR